MNTRKTPSEKDLKKAYSNLSHVYGIFESFFEKKLQMRSLELLDVRKGDSVLEIGFGAGYNLIELAKLVGENGKVYGIDLTHEMIKITRKRLEKNNFAKRVKLIEGNATKLPFSKNLFNIVYVSNVLELFSDKGIKKVLNEIKRVLKANGKICIVGVAKKDYENSIYLRFYGWLNKKFPSYTSLPIYSEKYLSDFGFKIIKTDIVKIFRFFPMQIVIGRK